jgi:putative ABC transport system permease protein
MIKNYLLITLRNLRKHFFYSLINIAGLALGLATCFLLFSWITHELSYDKFHEKSQRIYRVSMEYSFGGQVVRPSVSPTALLPALMTLPETETGVRVYNPSLRLPHVVKYGDKLFEETKFYLADSTFFDVFTFKLVHGDRAKALTEPYSVILTEAMAKKYFGEENPVGKTLFINNARDYKVTGVIENPPSNSLMRFDFIGSFSSIAAGTDQPTWWSANYQTYVLLRPHAELSVLQHKTDAIVKREVATELTGEHDYVRFNFTPLTDIYLRSDIDEQEVVSDIQYVYIFSAVALLILFIACINYVNLATARAADRAKEVGIRKVVGALRRQLFYQFIGESLLITCISFILAFLLAIMMLPFFNELTGKDFANTILLKPAFLIPSFIGLLIVALLAGVYPAVAITSFSPVKVLKGRFKTSGRGIWLRQSLVIFQFAVSVILITTTVIVLKQLDFISQKKLGFDRENTIVLPLDAKTNEVFESLNAELKRTGVATHIARGSESPANVKGGYSIRSSSSEGPGIAITGLLVDDEYIPALGMELISGRNFTKNDLDRVTKDTVYTFILNESALASMYMSVEDAIGKKVSIGGSRMGEIIGVVRNFHFSSLHHTINPLVMFPEEAQFGKLFIKLPTGNLSENLRKVQDICRMLMPHRPFEYQFLDQQYAALYQNEQRMGSIAVVFATLAIIIACVGLLGLISFTAAQKYKEIGIRKVLGASALGIVLLIIRDFTRPIMIAFMVGLPAAYWLITEFWLTDFAFRTDIGFLPFMISAAICIVIAIVTAGYQAIKASMLDPVETLRTE